MLKVIRGNPFNKVLPLIIIILTLVLFFVTSIFGSGFVYQLTGVYPYFVYKRLFGVFVVCLVFSKYLRTNFLKALKVDRNIIKIILSQPKFSKSLTLINFLVMLIFCTVYFNFSDKSFFAGTDGQHMLALNKMHSEYRDPIFYFTSNFFQGLGGNIPFPINHRADIGYIIGNIGPVFNVANALTTWFIFFSLSVFALCISLQINFKTSCIASWAAPILSMLPTSFVFTLIPTLTPHMLTSIAITNIILSAILFKSNSLIMAITRSLTVFLCCLYYLITNPTFILLSLPILLLVSIFSLIGLSKKKLVYEIIIVFLPVVAVSVLGGVMYMFGIFLNTSVLFFKNEFAVSERTLNTVSVIFSRRELASVIVLVSLLTAFWLFKNKSAPRNLNSLIKALLTFVVILLLSGVLYSKNPNLWLGPAPIYFEFMIWGIYSLFISVLFAHYLNKILKYFGNSSIKYSKAFERLASLAPAVLIFVYLLSLSIHQNSNQTVSNSSKDLKKSSILEFLENRNYQTRSMFHGRTITIFNPSDKRSLNWNIIDNEAKTYFREYGTDFMQGTLWIRKIPTVFEVNQLITPRSYFALTRNLANPNDQQLRDFTFLRNIKEDFLSQIGVRYLISNESLKIGKLLLSENSNGAEVFLYELPNVNVGDYFATKTIQIGSFSEAELIFKGNDLSRNNTVLVEKNIGFKDLVPPIKSELIINGNEYEVRAQSTGKTLLVLPIEFSNCFVFKSLDKSKLLSSMPVDISQLGLMFDKNLHAKFNYVNGPLANSDCRLMDYMELKKLES